MWETLRILEEGATNPLIKLPTTKSRDLFEDQMEMDAFIIKDKEEAPSAGVFLSVEIQDQGLGDQIEIGGRDIILRNRIKEELEKADFSVALLSEDEKVDSEKGSTFCNQNEREKGVLIITGESFLDEAANGFVEAVEKGLKIQKPEEVQGDFIEDAETWRDWHERYFSDYDSYLGYDGDVPGRLDPGDSGEEVEALQENLAEAGYEVYAEPNGEYDQETEDRVREFQNDHDLFVDGIAGQNTMSKLMEMLNTDGEGIDIEDTEYKAFQIPEREELEDMHSIGIGMERQDLFEVGLLMEKWKDSRWNWRFQIYEDEQNGEKYAMLHEINDDDANGWGNFAWHLNAKYNWCMDCVHSYQNINTSLLGARIFSWYRGHRWFMNGTDKLNLPENQDEYGRTWRSDCARNDWNPFHAFAMAGTRQDLLIIQPHGFGWDVSGRSEDEYVPHVLSDGDITFSQLAQEYSEWLTDNGIETFYYDDTNWQDLGAQTNRQGHWANARMESLGVFQHWELETHIRWNRDEPDKTDAEILDRNAEIMGDGLAEVYGDWEATNVRFNTVADEVPMESPRKITYPMTARFHNGDSNHLDITFNMAVERLEAVSEWESDEDLSIQSAEIVDAGYRVVCEVAGSRRGKAHKIVVKGVDVWGNPIHSEPVYAEGITSDDVWSGEDNLSEMDYRPYPTFPNDSVFTTVGVNGANFIRTQRFHSRLPHQRNGAVMMIRKRSPFSQWTWQGVELDEELTEEGWFRTYVYFPKDFQMRAANMIFGRIMENENSNDGIRLYLSSEQDEEYGDRYYVRINDGQEFTQYPSEARIELGQWHCVETGIKGIGTREGVSELWLDGEKIGEVENDYSDMDPLTFSRVGISFVSVVDERYEFYMDGVKVSKSRYGMDEPIDRIMPPLPNYIQEEKWNIGRFFASVPVNYNGNQVRVRARAFTRSGREIDTFVSSYQPQGRGEVTVQFQRDLPYDAEIYLDATDGETWSSVYRFDVFNVIPTTRLAQDKNTTYVMHFEDGLSFGDGLRQGRNSIVDDWKQAGSTYFNGQMIASETILAESLNVLARDRINNFSRTGYSEGWSETSDNTDFTIWESNSRGEDVARIRTDRDGGIESDLFVVDSSTSYEVVCSMWADFEHGRRQIEIKFFDGNKDPISGYISYDPEERSFSDHETSPFYLFDREGALTGNARGNYRKFTSHFISSEVGEGEDNEIPMGRNAEQYAVMPSHARYAQLLFHNIENGGEQADFYVYAPTVHNINAGTLHTDQVVAGKFKANRIDVLAMNHINNFTKSGEMTGWIPSSNNNEGSVELIEDEDERNGATIMRMRSEGDLDVESELFDVDPSVSHKLRINLKCEAENGTRQIGITFHDKEGDRIGNITRWSPENRGGDGDFTNTSPSFPYFVQHDGPLSDLDDKREDGWVHVEAIFAHADLTDPDDMPRGVNSRWNFVMPDNARYAKIRFLNRGNDKDADLLIHSPSITSVDDGTIRANKFRGGEFRIGGEEVGSGIMGFYNEEGDQVAEMTAARRGFRYLTIEELESDSVVSVARFNKAYYVDTENGDDDENDGLSRDKPVQQIMQILRDHPRYIERNITISVINDDAKIFELLDLRGFIGPGSLTINLHGGTILGGINAWNINLNCEVNNGEVVDDRGAGSATVWSNRSMSFRMNNVKIQTRGQRVYGFRNDLGSAVLWNCETYGAQRGFATFYGGQMTVSNECKGLAEDYGIYNYGGAVYGDGTCPEGETATSYTYYGGFYDELHVPDEGDAQRPEPDEIKRSFSSQSSDSWRDVYTSGWRANDDVYQGAWDGHGLHTGFWFFNNEISDALEGEKIISARIRAKRRDFHGYSRPVDVTFRTHQQSSRPSGSSEPWTSASSTTTSFDRNEEKWVELSGSLISNLQNGHKGIAIHTSSRSGTSYAIMHPDLILEVIIDNT